MDRRIIVVACVAAIGCGGSARSSGATSVSADGVYEFAAIIPGQQPGSTIRARGTLAIVADSLVINPGEGCAVVDAASLRATARAGVASLYCGGALLTFDKRNLAAATWSSRVSVPKQRNACVEYAPRNGQPSSRCLRWRPETYYALEQRSGSVTVQPIR